MLCAHMLPYFSGCARVCVCVCMFMGVYVRARTYVYMSVRLHVHADVCGSVEKSA